MDQIPYLAISQSIQAKQASFTFEIKRQMSSSEIEIFSEREETDLIGVNESKGRRIISSKVRERFSASFLEAKEAQGVLLQSRIPVDFKGNTHKPSTEFSIGQGDPGKNTFSCYIKDKKYFLCAENNEVFLMCSDGCNPNDDKFLFRVEKVDTRTRSSKYFTIQSAKTGKFLVSDESGDASMKEIKDQTDGKIYDRQAWFQFIPEDDMVTEKSVHTIREDIVFPGRIYEIQEAVICTLTKM